MTSDQSVFKRQKIYNHDEFGQFSAPTFNIGQLPLELQEMIIVKAAVALRLTSKTWGDVFEALAPVCKLWLDMLRNPVLYETIKRETFVKDPLCRYLQSAQPVRVIGVENTFIVSVVALGDRLYVAEVEKNVSRIFVYDLAVRAINQNRRKREITCTNRQPLTVMGLHVDYSVNVIVPCVLTNTLYVLEHHRLSSIEHMWTVVKVKPEDGTVLVKWSADYSETVALAMALSLSGACMVMTTCSNQNYTLVYCTLTGTLVNTIPATDYKMFPSAALLAVTLSDDSLRDFVKLTSSIKSMTHTAKTFIALEDGVLMELDRDDFRFIDSRTNRSRKLSVTTSMTKDAWMFTRSWYDKAHGLIFVRLRHGLKTIRITY